GVSSGPISFLKVFNAATDAVKQGGTRRGANMAILNIDHPQILEFITCKEDPTQLTNFNISVGITDGFMDAFYKDEEYELISPHTKEVVDKLSAREVFSLIVEMAHKNGEPGIVFLDRLNQYNPTPKVGKIESTNPCGEQPLLPNEACNLGSINLATMVEAGKVNWEKLRDVVCYSVDFLDNVIEQSKFPLPEIDKMVKANRKIGLGVMGWADLLFQLKIAYNSKPAIELAAQVMEFIDYHSKKYSMKLAKEKGSFPNFDKSIYATGDLQRQGKLDWEELISEIKENGIRNATTTTIAPTGTISMIANTSSGIEPQFSLVFVKHVMDDDDLLYVNPYFEESLREEGIYSEDLMKTVSDSGSLKEIEEIPANIKDIFVTSHDILPEWHIRMQAAFQKYVDNAVSKTINFPRLATKEDIRMSYELAYESGCKGVTVYRDGSRENQVLNVGKERNKEKQTEARVNPRQRPEITSGITQKIETGCGHLYVTVNSDEKGACEVFTQMGKVGGCASAQLEAVGRLISLCLRSNVSVDSISRQLRGIRCPSPMWHKGEMITSCADGIARSLEKFLQIEKDALSDIEKLNGYSKQGATTKASSGKLSGICPDCGSPIDHSEGCLKCHSCGWSKC
ncbi:MAG: adenosylcobalamin-dependent ribonucleoside-diphosphate reductase, partial [Candidatus Cloacimonadota bacterium]|nr:adenosylcobalamin-dependent ribonucleoside-diphosphate reductase [Candidatus Cloacimonadota bacterium]